MSSETTRNHLLGRVCPYFLTGIGAGVAVVICELCGMPHHADCWRENGRCTTFGCQGGSGDRPLVAFPAQVVTGAPTSTERRADSRSLLCSKRS